MKSGSEGNWLGFFGAVLLKSSLIIFPILILINTVFVCEVIGKKHKKRQTNQDILAASIVISKIKHGLSGYVGYVQIRDILLDVKRKEGINRAYAKASLIEKVSSPKLHFMINDVGLAFYYEWAFRIFGYYQESLESLYFLILSLSILVYLAAFWRDNLTLFVLLLFVTAHWLIVMASDIVGVELQVYNYRFYAVLAVLPATHIGLVMLKRMKLRPAVFFGVFVQAALLIFVIHSRGSAIYQLMFLVSLAGLLVLAGWVRRVKEGVAFSWGGLWVLVPVFGLFLVLKAHLMLTLNPQYQKTLQTHHFWCASFTSLSINPRMESEYGIPFFDDQNCHDAVARRAEKDGLAFIFDYPDHELFFHATDYPFKANNQVRFLSREYENYVRQEFMEYYEKDPWLVIGAYLLKIPGFVRTYFSSTGEHGHFEYLGAGKLLFSPLVLFVLAFGVLVFRKEPPRVFKPYLLLVGFQFLFSLIPVLVLMPISPLCTGFLNSRILDPKKSTQAFNWRFATTRFSGYRWDS